MRNQRRVTALVVMAGAAIVATGGLLASNMGFKLNYTLTKSGAGSKSGRQSIGLPYNRQVGIDKASHLLADVTAGGVAALQLEKFNMINDSNSPYPGVSDFDLEKGVGYLLRVNQSGPYIIVGSHDPGYAVPLTKAGAGSKSGRNRYAHPYHGVSATASELLAELSPDGLQVERFNPSNDSNTPYPATDFALVPGQAYLVRVVNNKSFIPDHY